MRGVARGSETRHGAHLGDAGGGREHGGSTQTVADQEGGGSVGVPEKIRRRNQVLDVGREAGVGKVPLALPESGEIEPEHRNAARRERPRDAGGGPTLLGAGEAMGKDGTGPGDANRPLQTGGQTHPGAGGKIDAIGHSGHGGSPAERKGVGKTPEFKNSSKVRYTVRARPSATPNPSSRITWWDVHERPVDPSRGIPLVPRMARSGRTLHIPCACVILAFTHTGVRHEEQS
jgi:hypothetical protein